MVKILNIVLDKKKYKVTTSLGEYKFSEEVLVEFFITKGKEIENDEFDAILEFADQNEFYMKALNFISFKERSVFEVREYLFGKGMVNPEQVIDRLCDKGFLNDEVYASHFLDYSINNMKGPNYYKSELIKKRINSELIEENLMKYDFELQYDTLLRLFNKNLKMKQISYNKYKRQLTDKFVRSGFNIGLINEVLINNLEELKSASDEENALLKDYEKIKSLPKDKVIKKLMQKGYNYGKIKDIVD